MKSKYALTLRTEILGLLDDSFSNREPIAFKSKVEGMADLAALGFPELGEMRVVDIGPCEEGE